MKTITSITATITLLVIMTSTYLNAANPKWETSDDMFFGMVNLETADNKDSFKPTRYIADFILEEEAYIDDISFDMEWITESIQISNLKSVFNLKEENEINDIPFNTACIKANCLCKCAMAVVFEMADEPFINDIPFNTNAVVNNKTCALVCKK